MPVGSVRRGGNLTGSCGQGGRWRTPNKNHKPAAPTPRARALIGLFAFLPLIFIGADRVRLLEWRRGIFDRETWTVWRGDPAKPQAAGKRRAGYFLSFSGAFSSFFASVAGMNFSAAEFMQ